MVEINYLYSMNILNYFKYPFFSTASKKTSKLLSIDLIVIWFNSPQPLSNRVIKLYYPAIRFSVKKILKACYSLPYNKKLTKRVKELRKNMTKEEKNFGLNT